MDSFDSLAKNYDIERRIKRAKAFADEIRLHIENGHKKSALEYGCGTGLVGFNLLHDFNLFIFVDSSSNMIEQVNQKILNLEQTSSYAICRDFISDVPNDLKVDYVIASLVVHHIKDVKTILLRFYNLLNNGGHLLIIDKNTGSANSDTSCSDFDEYDGFNQSELINMTREVGFKDAISKTFFYSSNTSNGIFILNAKK